ncbi:MAG: fibronectin type III domain-containing protein [Flavobacteriales bacterium]|nr:fibronectin type III domain-containing protein [Flavobacteriales bacterium]
MLRYLPFFLFPAILNAQGQGTIADRIQRSAAEGKRFQPVELFQVVEADPAAVALWSDACTKATVLDLDRSAVRVVLGSRPERIALSIPDPAGIRVLDLERVEITAPGFVVRVSSTGGTVPVPEGIHYRGMIRGVPGSLVAISIFEEEVMGLIGDPSDDIVLGRLAGDAEGRHILYREGDLRGTPNMTCGTSDQGPAYDQKEIRPEGNAKTIRCVNLYWESAYDLFQNKGSVVNVTTYLTGLFNQMATLYANDNVQVVLSEIYVWNTPSPYDATSSSGRLNQFGSTRTSFNGDLAHLIDLGGYGGVAWLGSLCGGTSSRMAYSGINTTYSSVPTYSWSAEVVTHETGHNLGSRHTHACAWNGDNTAIDGCGPAAGYSEGSCPAGPVPTSSVGGTIMSYCHLVSSIKFANGFGPQPKAVIVSRVNSASCLNTCGTSCDPPEPLSTSNLNATTVTLTWANFGVPSYSLQWRTSPSGGWNTVSGILVNNYALTGLTQSTAYDLRVLSVCAAASSAYSAIYTFTTPVPCPDSLEPNNSTGAAPLVTLPASINALIASSGDADYYRFTLTATSTVNIYLSNVAADYDLRLLNSSGTQIATSGNSGTSSEYINYPSAAAGTYYVHVYGYSGAFNASQCYYLSISAYVACAVPQGVQVSGITYNSAGVSWVAQPGGSMYDLRWKPTSSGTWTDVFALATNSYNLAGLSPLTSYDVQVRAACQGGTQGGVSDYTPTTTFTTLEAPCDVVPRTVLAARLYLDGAYRSANGLMVDSLRMLNQIPLTEPYTAMGRVITGPTTTTAIVLGATGNNAPVDWVLVELRANTSPYSVLESRVGLVQRDGDVVAPDGVSPLGFCEDPGTYRIAVRHRNHLGCMTANGFILSGTATSVDLTSSGTSTYGTNARRTVGAVRTLWSGNVIPDAELKYTGGTNDRDPILQAIGGSAPTNVVLGNYAASDVNMDGRIKYVGQDNDRDPILTNVGGSIPTNTILEQLP